MDRRNWLRTAPAAVLSAATLVRAANGFVIGPVDGSNALVGVHGVSLPPATRGDARSLVDVGVFEAEGYASLVLNFAGQIKGHDYTGGDVGAILIPDVAPYDSAFSNMGLLPVSLSIGLHVSSQESPYFTAPQVRVDVGFPRYRVLFFNETNVALGASFFAYRCLYR